MTQQAQTLQELVQNVEYFNVDHLSPDVPPKRIICILKLHSGVQVNGEYFVPEGSPVSDYNPFALTAAIENLKQLGFEIIEPQAEPQVIEGEAVEVVQNTDDPSFKAVEAPTIENLESRVSSTGSSGSSYDIHHAKLHTIEVLTSLLKAPRVNPKVLDAANTKLVNLIEKL
ncbi:hypothetical protein [Acinetobacter pittii]|uniref:hypothetical protein n=1 Tax=Acinetobacter pittii TaxID=48296 RepID=UPI000837CC78|nr:hypothetical protein [Acinetobacter pittii]MCG5256913.1 hypothetical protein [Acinetobacter pittii]MCK0901505.1 hypothetical protein [Acinetobacter pittii]MCU4554685.1 hypothetical protein [Acinetobacter pittii]MEC6001683.1 hypothetical protein [Acinetobacter pittii]